MDHHIKESISQVYIRIAHTQNSYICSIHRGSYDKKNCMINILVLDYRFNFSSCGEIIGSHTAK